jgi:hypothetical protein
MIKNIDKSLDLAYEIARDIFNSHCEDRWNDIGDKETILLSTQQELVSSIHHILLANL